MHTPFSFYLHAYTLNHSYQVISVGLTQHLLSSPVSRVRTPVSACEMTMVVKLDMEVFTGTLIHVLHHTFPLKTEYTDSAPVHAAFTVQVAMPVQRVSMHVHSG